jgi:Flp pilus assembly protein TadG
MSHFSMRKLGNLLSAMGIGRLFKDRRGTSAIEFALIAPLLIAAFLGMSELTQGMMAARRTSHLAATIGDLAAQSDALTAANLTDLYAIGASMLQPFPAGTGLKIRLSSVSKRTDGKARVDWSDGHNLTKYANETIITGPAMDQLATGKAVMMTEVTYDYHSTISEFLPDITTFSNIYYHHPRNGDKVTGPS